MERSPRLELKTTSATLEETAAAMAAVEQFMRDTAPAAVEDGPAESGWLRAARLEAVDRDPVRP